MKRIGKKDKTQNNKKDDPNKLPEDFLKIFYSGEVRDLEKDLDRMKEIFQTYNLNAVFGYDEKTAVFFANHISWKAMRWLVEQGADINARNKWGLTPLHDIIIFAGGRLSTVELLVELGADIHALTPDGNTPLHEAASWGRLPIAKMLIERGVVMDARNNKGQNPMEYMLSNANNSNICNILLVAEYFLSIGMPVTDQAVQSVKKLSKSFVFHHYGADNSDKVLEAKEALQRLLELFGIPALPVKRTYDGKAKIIAKPGSWQEEFEELFLWILSPPLERKAGTVQGELLRLSEYFYRMIRKNGITDEWSRLDSRLMFHAFLHYLHMGNPLYKEDCKEVKCVIREIIHGEKTLRPEKLCEYSVYWIRKNPDPIKLWIIFYIP